MKRMSVILVAALLAAAPLQAVAQDGPRGSDRRPPREQQQQRPERPQMSSAEAQRIAQSRAGDARFVGYRGFQNGSHVFTFERDGRVFNVSVDASR
jgi:Ni/Co efflux regulator RcnB